jgi:hypothetical protein
VALGLCLANPLVHNRRHRLLLAIPLSVLYFGAEGGSRELEMINLLVPLTADDLTLTANHSFSVAFHSQDMRERGVGWDGIILLWQMSGPFAARRTCCASGLPRGA